jgi:hypothetical protein
VEEAEASTLFVGVGVPLAVTAAASTGVVEGVVVPVDEGVVVPVYDATVTVVDAAPQFPAQGLHVESVVSTWL